MYAPQDNFGTASMLHHTRSAMLGGSIPKRCNMLRVGTEGRQTFQSRRREKRTIAVFGRVPRLCKPLVHQVETSATPNCQGFTWSNHLTQVIERVPNIIDHGFCAQRRSRFAHFRAVSPGQTCWQNRRVALPATGVASPAAIAPMSLRGALSEGAGGYRQLPTSAAATSSRSSGRRSPRFDVISITCKNLCTQKLWLTCSIGPKPEIAPSGAAESRHL